MPILSIPSLSDASLAMVTLMPFERVIYSLSLKSYPLMRNSGLLNGPRGMTVTATSMVTK